MGYTVACNSWCCAPNLAARYSVLCVCCARSDGRVRPVTGCTRLPRSAIFFSFSFLPFFPTPSNEMAVSEWVSE